MISRPALALIAVLLAGCAGGGAPPEEVAREYGRALFASDAGALWSLISTDDRRAKDEATFRRQQGDVRGFAREVLRQLAGYITATPVRTTVAADRATVTLRFRLPDANAPAVQGLMRDWDESRLNTLATGERQRIVARLGELHRQGTLAMVEGDETMELVREAAGWKVFLNWAGGVRVTFSATVDPGLPLDVSVSPPSVVLAPGERVRVSVRATNRGTREVTTRVGHRIEPDAEADHLALLQCPLLVPVRLAPGAQGLYESEYLLLADVPAGTRALSVRYRFPAAAAQRR
jgi:hypothetical protein